MSGSLSADWTQSVSIHLGCMDMPLLTLSFARACKSSLDTCGSGNKKSGGTHLLSRVTPLTADDIAWSPSDHSHPEFPPAACTVLWSFVSPPSVPLPPPNARAVTTLPQRPWSSLVLVTLNGNKGELDHCCGDGKPGLPPFLRITPDSLLLPQPPWIHHSLTERSL
ncbi:hypothetical protein VFPFJ_09924 [Purpureocillium lilacinum]|uniref:Uncharacterized protein n=1 Tax=Purpureocillium lilacinum TaxID=33203 RepID=A0A179GPM2_PURLI|nr:hypothetical protein VFPFJ_09924 [Purpureocillium lilacinum]OAQ79438.1 hypothetical protein VFPFJ_09924 [Purpureocillium lilacinum]